MSPDCAIAAATLTVVVVFPTPPFWLATVSTRVWGGCGKERPTSEMRRRASSATSNARGVDSSTRGRLFARSKRCWSS